MSARARELLFGEEREATSIVQAGQLVDQRERVQVALVAELRADVACEDDDRRPIVIDARARDDLDVQRSSARGPQTAAHARCAAARVVGRLSRQRGARLLVREVVDRSPDERILARKTEHFGRRGIREEDLAVRVNEHGLRRQRQQLPVARIGLTQRAKMPTRVEAGEREHGEGNSAAADQRPEQPRRPRRIRPL